MGSHFTLITVCKGRLPHLQQTLPTWLQLSGCEWIVVDVACPAGTGAWVSANYHQVRVVSLDDGRPFSLARARNHGAAAATTPWLMFIDADIAVRSSFAEFAQPQTWASDCYYRVLEPCKTLSGTCLCQRKDYEAIQGYDEVMCGWGGEDRDFYWRLEQSGRHPRPLKSVDFHLLPHDDTLRTEHYEIRDVCQSQSLHQLYVEMKHELQLLRKKPLNLEERQALYERLRKGVLTAWCKGEAAHLEIAWQEQTYWNKSRARKSLRYQLLPPPATNFPNLADFEQATRQNHS